MTPVAIKIIDVESTSAPTAAKPLPDHCAWGMVEGLPVIVKSLSRKKIINECVGYLAAKTAGLNTPEAFLVRPTGDEFQFVSTYKPLRLLQDMNFAWDNPFWADAHKTKWFATLFAFDAWIGNYDRVMQNIWFEGDVGDDTLVVLDHDKILFHENWDALVLNDYYDRACFNELSRSITKADVILENHLAKGAEQMVAAVDQTALTRLLDLRDCGLATRQEVKSITGVLTSRLKHLPNLVIRALVRNRQ